MKVNNIPMVSVIIPTYNRMKTLPRAIASVLSQTYQNIELIIVDDGSTDGTEEYVLGLQNSRIRYIKNEMNLGPSATRNKGAQIAKGEYIAFQDSDDDWKLDKLEKQMKVMLDTAKPVKMVYCEIAMYDSNGKFYLLVPSKDIELQKKEGDLFSYLLLNALISTQTMLIEREAFLEMGGFNEELQSYEDWEFSLRFAERYHIGFVEEDLAQVHFSPNSVNQRHPERIRTQMHMMQEMISQLRERGLLQAKFEEIQWEASSLNCYATFMKEWIKIRNIFTDEEREQFERIVQGITSEHIKKNAIKIEANDKIEEIKAVVLKLYESVLAGKDVWVKRTTEGLRECVATLVAYGKLFQIATIKENEHKYIQESLAGEVTTTVHKLEVLEKIFVIIEKMQEYIDSNEHVCNVCGQHVFFEPIPTKYSESRKNAGFLYWNADFQLESKKKYSCPLCGAYDRDRLMIAFLDKLRPEKGEKLRMLQVSPSRAIEAYALNREYIIYESTDLKAKDVTFNADLHNMSIVENDTYDIIVCSHILDHVEDDAKAMRELYRILKPQGVCLVLVPLAVGKNDTDEQLGCSVAENWRRFGQGDRLRFYGKRDFINRLQNAGFCVNELGKDWFGEEFYMQHGFDNLSIMYVATKDLCLVEPKEDLTEKQNRRLIDLEEENRLLRHAVMNLSERMEAMEKDRIYSTSIVYAKINNLSYEILDPRYMNDLWWPKIMSIDETWNEVLFNKKSIARFGDGEFAVMAGVDRWRFQRTDDKLALRLKEVLASHDDNILVSLIDFYGGFPKWTDAAANGARLYMTAETRKQHYELLERDRVYANTSMSRNETWEDVERQKKLWDGRDCVFIEGYQTRMGVGNNLFDNAKSIQRILCPAESAFDRYDEILAEALKLSKDKLILIALGPTATVLAYDLAKAGYWAIDIGHADLSYEWMLRGKFHGDHAFIPNKYNNEMENGYIVEDINDVEYESQIIADFH